MISLLCSYGIAREEYFFVLQKDQGWECLPEKHFLWSYLHNAKWKPPQLALYS